MIGSLLIANRGEIAVRIIRTCRDMGIRTVAVHSTADRNAMHVRMADRSVCIGGPRSSDSYLNAANIIGAACLTRCDAIHPGVGFLSENAAFARAVEEAGLIFIGPKPATIALLGDKIAAKKVAKEAGLATTPGSDGPLETLESALEVARTIGYPVLLKAAAGGGGRGMRIVNNPEQMPDAFATATREARSFFADGTLLLERCLIDPKHVEVQVLADSHGNVVHVGNRDCSVQKHHQKLIEESPSAALDAAMATAMGEAATRLFGRLGYRGAGTVEFLVHEGSFWFMEVNARLQVEHPVTEAVAALDLVREQIMVASGQPLEIRQSDIHLAGHALECRINASGTGKISHLELPAGPMVRVDTHIAQGFEVSPYYDHLLAKIIVHTPTRNQSIATMHRALGELVIQGVDTNRDEQLAIIGSAPFRSGRFGTGLYTRLGLGGALHTGAQD